MSKLRTPWIDPVSVDPKHFVNRTKDRRFLREMLEEYVDYKRRKATLLIGGERGIGKSIFGRTVLQDLADGERKRRVLTLVVEARTKSIEGVLIEYAKKLAERAQALAAEHGRDDAWAAQWLAPLFELATNQRISRRAHELLGNEHGASGEVASGLWGLLTGKFGAHWKERREQGQTVETSLEVTEEVLLVAINGVLTELSKTVTVIVLLDDLDQAAKMDTAENAKPVFDLVLGLAPAVHLVHLRSEVTFPDIRRELDETIELGPLDPDELHQILKRRADDAEEADQRLLTKQGWDPLRRLCQSTGNPYVLLRWATALVRLNERWPPPKEWMDPAPLRQVVVQTGALPRLPDEEILCLGTVLDRLDKEVHITESELRAGHRQHDSSKGAQGLSEALIGQLKRFEVLLPVDRFDSSRGLRINPLIKLIRPSCSVTMKSLP